MKNSQGSCPCTRAIHLIGNKWNLIIVNLLSQVKTPMRFNEILKAIKPVSSKTLSIKLKYLKNIGIIIREIIPDTPVRIQYSLTEMGKELQTLLDAMREWSIKWTQPQEIEQVN